jgi:hypothetical protein
LRFTASDGYTLIDYWIQTGCNTSTTYAFVKVPSVANGSTTIYMYYGDSTATIGSNAANTFLAGNNSYEVDASGMTYSSISYWDWREGRGAWADGRCGSTDWGNTVCCKQMTTENTRYFSGTRGVYDYLRSCDDSGAEDNRFAVQELYLESAYRAVAFTVIFGSGSAVLALLLQPVMRIG